MTKQAYNPYLPLHVYIPDGEPHVFGDRVYVFGSHDREAGITFCSEPYEVWSAPVDDLGNWSCPGVSYRAQQDPYYDREKRNAMYAPDAVQGNDGRYYLYYCLSGWRGRGGYGSPISVAVSEKPDGPYEYLGVVRNPDGTPFMKYGNFDPAVVNDHGVIRLYSGTWYPEGELSEEERQKIHADETEAERFCKPLEHIRALQAAGDSVYGPHHMVLADDMRTLCSEPVRILPLKRYGTPFETVNGRRGHGFFEGSSIRIINGKYYFIYSSRNNHELCYAVSDRPDRDFVYGGTIVSNGDIGYHGRREEDRLNITGTTHGSIEQINGQWYVFYHRLTHKSDYSRQGCAERITIDEKGHIDQVEITSCGLNNGPLVGEGSYPAVICCVLSNGHMPHSSNSIQEVFIPYIGSKDGERMIRDISDHTLIGYRYFSFQDCAAVSISIRGKGTGRVTVRTDMEGETVGEALLEGSDSWTDVRIPVTPIRSVKPLYFFFEGSGIFEMKTLTLIRNESSEV